jgi:hypothetical protein
MDTPSNNISKAALQSHKKGPSMSTATSAEAGTVLPEGQGGEITSSSNPRTQRNAAIAEEVRRLREEMNELATQVRAAGGIPPVYHE